MSGSFAAGAPVFGRWHPLFFGGAELFNRKKFFEAHEEWEKLWMSLPKDDAMRDFYKGLIQAAAVFEHLRRKNLSGAQGLLGTSVPLLERFAPRAEGLDVQALLGDLKRVTQELDPARLDAIKPPQIKLWAD